MNYWLVKQNPESYSFSDLIKEKKTDWTGVRNYQARKFLREMRSEDEVLFYHSGKEKSIVGIARVVRDPYPDPTATDGDWVAVDLAPAKTFAKPVSLDYIKTNKQLANMRLIKQSRLSVVSVEDFEFEAIVEQGG